MEIWECKHVVDLNSGWSKGGHEGCAPPGIPNSFNFMQFLENFGKIVCWCPPRGVGTPSFGKSWIRHCFINNNCERRKEETYRWINQAKYFTIYSVTVTKTNQNFYRLQTKFLGKVIFLHLFVILFSGGVHGWWGVHRIWQDTVNERAVRILLECILVINYVF